MRRGTPLNLLELRPARTLSWEPGEDGRAVLLVPKFRNPLMVRWILPFFSRRHFRVRLDRFGTFVWERCDGNTPVERIGAELSAAFGSEVEPLYHRIGKFISRLQRDGFISIEHP